MNDDDVYLQEADKIKEDGKWEKFCSFFNSYFLPNDRIALSNWCKRNDYRIHAEYYLDQADRINEANELMIKMNEGLQPKDLSIYQVMLLEEKLGINWYNKLGYK